MTIRHEIIRDAESLVLMAPSWRALWGTVEIATPFLHPDWLTSWWDIFAPGELRAIAVFDGSRVIGLAPLYVERDRGRTRLLPLGISLSDYTDVLVDPRHWPEAVDAIAFAIAKMSDIDELELGELPPNAMALRISAPAGWQHFQDRGSACPVLTLPGSPDELSQAIPHSRLRHLRTARNRAAKRGEVAIIEGDVDNAEALLTELIRLHSLRWQGKGDGVFADSRVAQFHNAALPHLMRDSLVRLYALTINETVVGVYYGFLHRGRAYAYLCGYDPDFAFESPGAILLGHAIEQAVQEGASEFHFLRGREAYKYEWGAKDRWNTRLILAPELPRVAHG